MSGHSPAPWEVGPTGHVIRTAEREDADGRFFPRKVLARLETDDNPRDAHMMAAAPALYDSVIDLNAALAAYLVGAPLSRELLSAMQRRADAAVRQAEGAR